MCPLCTNCEYYHLNETCLATRLASVADTTGAVVYAVFISLWGKMNLNHLFNIIFIAFVAVTFAEFWKRKSAELAYRWNVMDYEIDVERPRPSFSARAVDQLPNPITGIIEPYFPPFKRAKRMLAGSTIILFMVIVVLIFIFGVIIYRLSISHRLFENRSTRESASVIATSTGAFINLIIIMAMNKIYQKLALWITEWEMHRTKNEFEDHYTFKVFIFQFVNFYSSTFYLAFIKGSLPSYPNHYSTLSGITLENVSVIFCLI